MSTFHLFFLFFKGFIFQVAISDTSVFVLSGFQHLLVWFFFFHTWEKTTVCLFVVSTQMFYHAFTHHFGAVPPSVFLFVFFAVQSRVGRKQVVKCHRPWTVWIGEDLWPQSPSNIHIFTTFWVHLQHIGLKAIRKPLFSRHQKAFLTKHNLLVIPDDFTWFFILWKESFFVMK